MSAEMPYLQETDWELVINLMAAKELGLEMPAGWSPKAYSFGHFRSWHQTDMLGQTMSAPEGKTDVPREPGHFRF
jgi:hypothetical protein